MLLVQSPTQLSTPSAQVVQVTEVKANPTKLGLDLVLQTSSGQQLQLVNRSAGNSFIVDIPFAQLRLPSVIQITQAMRTLGVRCATECCFQ